MSEFTKDLECENAKLRNEVDNLLDIEHLTSVAVAYAGCDECGEYKQTMFRLFAENAKLRELVREAVDAASLKDIRDWRYGKRLAFLREARELGIEVE